MQTRLTPGVPTVDQVDAAALVLGRAFTQDPLFTRTLRDPLRRHAALPLTFRALIREFAPHGGLDLVEREGEVVGAALWADGGHNEITLRSVLTHGQLRFGIAAGVRDALGLMRAQNAATRTHRELVTQPHAYLLALGVDPQWQGQGIGGALLDHGLAWVDGSGRAAYLETNLPTNATFYRGRGFETLREADSDGFRTWYMLRPAH